MSYRRYAPPKARWMDLKYAGTCAQCSRALPKGSRAFYDPADQTVCCTDLACSDAHGVTTQKAVWGATGPVTVLSEHRMGRASIVRDPGEDMADRWTEAQ